jgi:hypothetical protein
MRVLTAVEQQLTQRTLGRVREVVASAITQAEQQQVGYGAFLDEVLAEELVGCQEHQFRRKRTQAGVPYAAPLEQCDWQARPALKRSVMMRSVARACVEQAGAR